MPILAQPFFAFVRGDLVSVAFFTAGHLALLLFAVRNTIIDLYPGSNTFLNLSTAETKP